MTEQRIQEIKNALQGIIDGFEPTEDERFLTMHGLISRYNKTGQNIEMVGGDWAVEQGFDLR